MQSEVECYGEKEGICSVKSKLGILILDKAAPSEKAEEASPGYRKAQERVSLSLPGASRKQLNVHATSGVAFQMVAVTDVVPAAI